MKTEPDASETRLGTALFDLDGVVRWFDKERVPALEREHGLDDGVLRSTAFAPELLQLAITGQITRAEWTRRVGEAVGSVQAAAAWLNHRGNVNHAVIEVVRELRTGGITVAILTNGTETVPQELADLGIAHEFDAIFTTAEIGYAKPDRRAFQHVCDVLGVLPTTVFFTDDTSTKLQGAIELGMHARLFTSVGSLRQNLAELGWTGRP